MGRSSDMALLLPACGRDAEADRGALAGAALDGHRAPELARALAHADEAEVALVGSGGLGRDEAAAVVGDGQGHRALLVDQAHADRARLRVFEGVGQRLLRYAEQAALRLAREVNGAALDAHAVLDGPRIDQAAGQ